VKQVHGWCAGTGERARAEQRAPEGATLCTTNSFRRQHRHGSRNTRVQDGAPQVRAWRAAGACALARAAGADSCAPPEGCAAAAGAAGAGGCGSSALSARAAASACCAACRAPPRPSGAGPAHAAGAPAAAAAASARTNARTRRSRSGPSTCPRQLLVSSGVDACALHCVRAGHTKRASSQCS